MKLVLLKSTLEILTTQISKQSFYGRCFFPTFYLMTNNIFESFKMPHFTTQNLNNPASNDFVVLKRVLFEVTYSVTGPIL